MSSFLSLLQQQQQQQSQQKGKNLWMALATEGTPAIATCLLNQAFFWIVYCHPCLLTMTSFWRTLKSSTYYSSVTDGMNFWSVMMATLFK
jgi:hypothetical protein